MDSIDLMRPKVCSCGKEHFSIPETAKVASNGDHYDGYYWNCECSSTLFIAAAAVDSFLVPAPRMRAA